MSPLFPCCIFVALKSSFLQKSRIKFSVTVPPFAARIYVFLLDVVATSVESGNYKDIELGAACQCNNGRLTGLWNLPNQPIGFILMSELKIGPLYTYFIM